MEIQIRPAVTREDRLAVLEVSRMAFAPDLLPRVHAAQCLASARRTRATWWLLRDEEGRPAAGLLAYDDLVFCRGDERRQAVGLGGVSTRTDARRRGYASRLCAQVAEQHGGAGLLFSAIDPALYARLGYVAAEAWEFVSADLEGLVGSGPVPRLWPLDPRRERDMLAEAWRASQSGWFLERDDARWDATLLEYSGHVFFAVEGGGFVRLNVEEDCIWIVELAAMDADGALRAVAALASELSLPSVQGWLEPGDLVFAFFEDKGREKTLPMLRGVEDAASARFSSADYF